MPEWQNNSGCTVNGGGVWNYDGTSDIGQLIGQYGTEGYGDVQNISTTLILTGGDVVDIVMVGSNAGQARWTGISGGFDCSY